MADKVAIDNWNKDVLLNNHDIPKQNKYTVLLAEDDPSSQLLIKKFLNMAGHTVTTVNDGQEALERLELHSYDVCIFDMQMPVMSGIETVKIYKNKHPENTVPIMILTANTEDEAIEKCINAGADMHLAKPISFKSLVEAVNKICLKNSESEEVKNDLVIDITHLEHFKDPVFLNEFIEKFEVSADKLVKELKNSLLHNYDGFMDTVHSIKGLSGNINAHSLLEIANKAESMTENEYIKESTSSYKNIVQELTKVRNELTNYSACH